MPITGKPAKKTADRFPLSRHPTGQWFKTHRGRFYYFGTDKEVALRRYATEWDGIKAGLPRPRPEVETPAGATIVYVCNAFMAAKRAQVTGGELTLGTWRNYFQVCAAVVKVLGRNTPVAGLQPADFGRLRAAFAKARGPNTLTTWVCMARVLFRFAAELTDRPARYGDQFRTPAARVRRIHDHGRAPRLLEPAQLRAILDRANPTMRAAVLLGLNCGFGATDLSELRQAHLEARTGWVALPRHKTGVARRCPLWPETSAAIEAAWAIRPKPADSADADRLFISEGGQPVVRDTPGAGGKPGGRSDAIAKGWPRLCRTAGVTAPKGSGFYLLRHVFETVAGETLDQVVVDQVMGHVDASMAAVYRERVTDERFVAVTNHVRAWLWPKQTPAARARKEKSKK